MDYRTLGRSGLKVSELCLGAMTFGREIGETESFALLDRFVAAGGTFIDTADTYTRGRSEEIVGAWLARQSRDDIVLATKVRFGTEDPANRRPNRFGLSRKHIVAEVDASLRRLQTDYIDLYQVHNWDPETPLDETLGALDDIVRAGKVRYIGASNFTGWQLQKAIDLSRAGGLARFVCLQPLYNLLDRETEWELLPVCRNEGLGVIPWSPLRGGWLTGKYHRGMAGPGTGTRVEIAPDKGWSETWARYANERTWTVVDTLAEIAREVGRSPAAVALNWVSHRPGVTAPIIGARSLAQLDDNLAAAGWALSPEQVNRLVAVSTRPLPYPYETHARLFGGL
jgi:aryl-alcohol dehydrogenase-like predicted oxidoreductase